MSMPVFTSIIAVAALSSSCFACGKYIVRGNGEVVYIVDDPNPRPVKFSASIEEAKDIAAKRGQPFVVLFCTPEVALTAGEGEKEFEEYRKAHNGEYPAWTVFDCPKVSDVIRNFGVCAFVKVAKTPANEAIFKEYDAQVNMLMLFSPAGVPLRATSGNSRSGVETMLQSAGLNLSAAPEEKKKKKSDKKKS
ncbi:MAG TPA: hypothetical protein VEK08_18385 [Planctomycetota bacterium]|nr:hypothetical protein [Planctomycetota bacterium]